MKFLHQIIIIQKKYWLGFSTKIYSSDPARQKNLEITSKALNGTIVKPNETFSFTTTVGPSTPSKGYEEADIFDSNGNKVKGYGGGKIFTLKIFI